MSFWKNLFGGGKKASSAPVRPRTKSDEFNDAALAAYDEGKDLTVERLLIRKALNEFLERASWDRMQSYLYEATDGFFERDNVSYNMDVAGFTHREAQYGRIHDIDKNEISGKVRLRDKITKHIVIVSRPDIIPQYEEALKITSLAERYKMAVNFSVDTSGATEYRPRLTEGNYIREQNNIKYDGWGTVLYSSQGYNNFYHYFSEDDIPSSRLHISFSRLEA